LVRLAINALFVKRGGGIELKEGETCPAGLIRKWKTCFGGAGWVRLG